MKTQIIALAILLLTNITIYSDEIKEPAPAQTVVTATPVNVAELMSLVQSKLAESIESIIAVRKNYEEKLFEAEENLNSLVNSDAAYSEVNEAKKLVANLSDNVAKLRKQTDKIKNSFNKKVNNEMTKLAYSIKDVPVYGVSIHAFQTSIAGGLAPNIIPGVNTKFFNRTVGVKGTFTPLEGILYYARTKVDGGLEHEVELIKISSMFANLAKDELAGKANAMQDKITKELRFGSITIHFLIPVSSIGKLSSKFKKGSNVRSMLDSYSEQSKFKNDGNVTLGALYGQYFGYNRASGTKKINMIDNVRVGINTAGVVMVGLEILSAAPFDDSETDNSLGVITIERTNDL